MIHLHGIWYAPTAKRCDVRVSKKTKDNTHRKLRDEVVRATAREPRHFKEHEHFRQTGETA